MRTPEEIAAECLEALGVRDGDIESTNAEHVHSVIVSAIEEFATQARAGAIASAAGLVPGESAEWLRGSEYVRGQVELIADVFGYAAGDDGDATRAGILDAIVSAVAS